MNKISYKNVPETLTRQWKGFNDCLKQISDAVPVEQLILFGSFSRNEATDESDVDLCVVSTAAESQLDASRKIRKALWNVNACPPLTLLPITPVRLREKLDQHDPLFEDILREGISLIDEN